MSKKLGTQNLKTSPKAEQTHISPGSDICSFRIHQIRCGKDRFGNSNSAEVDWLNYLIAWHIEVIQLPNPFFFLEIFNYHY